MVLDVLSSADIARECACCNRCDIECTWTEDQMESIFDSIVLTLTTKTESKVYICIDGERSLAREELRETKYVGPVTDCNLSGSLTRYCEAPFGDDELCFLNLVLDCSRDLETTTTITEYDIDGNVINTSTSTSTAPSTFSLQVVNQGSGLDLLFGGNPTFVQEETSWDRCGPIWGVWVLFPPDNVPPLEIPFTPLNGFTCLTQNRVEATFEYAGEFRVSIPEPSDCAPIVPSTTYYPTSYSYYGGSPAPFAP